MNGNDFVKFVLNYIKKHGDSVEHDIASQLFASFLEMERTHSQTVPQNPPSEAQPPAPSPIDVSQGQSAPPITEEAEHSEQ